MLIKVGRVFIHCLKVPRLENTFQIHLILLTAAGNLANTLWLRFSGESLLARSPKASAPPATDLFPQPLSHCLLLWLTKMATNISKKRKVSTVAACFTAAHVHQLQHHSLGWCGLLQVTSVDRAAAAWSTACCCCRCARCQSPLLQFQASHSASNSLDRLKQRQKLI